MEKREAGPRLADIATARDIEAFEAELGLRVVAPILAVSPAKAHVEIGSDPKTHPLRKGGWILPTAEEIATVEDATGNLVIDPVVFRSVQEMDGGGS